MRSSGGGGGSGSSAGLRSVSSIGVDVVGDDGGSVSPALQVDATRGLRLLRRLSLQCSNKSGSQRSGSSSVRRVCRSSCGDCGRSGLNRLGARNSGRHGGSRDCGCSKCERGTVGVDKIKIVYHGRGVVIVPARRRVSSPNVQNGGN